MKEWFEKELIELSFSPLVKLTIHVTRALDASTSGNEQQTVEKATAKESNSEKYKVDSDPEKASGSCSPTTRESTLPVMLGRPDISAAIRSIVGATEEHDRSIVAACGPDSLMSETRSVVADLVANSGRTITLHCEQFGW